MALTALNRILPPAYGDGIDSPRKSTTGAQLPSARVLSNKLTRDLSNPDPRWSALMMSFGQFVDHDMSHTPVFKNGNQDIDCCNSDAQGDLFSSMCLPIPVPRNDNLNTRCMNLARSQVAAPLDCSIRYREQQNQLTHWLDTSQIYGSSQAELRELRSGRSGKLGTARNNLLPTDTTETCEEGDCFKAGDGRVNEQPGLSILHTMFLREHNRVAGQLANINPGWNDEKLFQEAKRIVNAEFQHIVYNEWLPAVLGKRYMNTYGLFPLTSGFSSDYDPSIDPRINNEFSAAAMRFGHSLIPGIMNVYARVGRNLNPQFELKKAFNKPELLRLTGMMEGLIKGFTRDSMQQFDAGFVDDVTQSLFDGNSVGMDLVALNIQRGRDHGLQGYNEYRKICGLGRANSFSDFSRQMSLSASQRLQKEYNTVDDVDLFAGLFSERPATGAIVGPTTLCIVGDQFARLKKGDRYFYDLGGQAGSFTQNQLNEMRKTSMARLFCDNSNVGEMQPLAFQTPANFNPLTSCSNTNTIPRPNLSAWAQTSSNFQSGNIVRNG